MKKLSSLMLLLLFPLLANSWGLLSLYMDPEFGKYKKWLSRKMVSGGDILYCIDGDLSGVSIQELDSYVQRAVKDWTAGSAAFIEKSGRAEEFSDILPFLKKTPRVIMAGCAGNAYKEDSKEYASDKPGYYGDALSLGRIETKYLDFILIPNSPCFDDRSCISLATDGALLQVLGGSKKAQEFTFDELVDTMVFHFYPAKDKAGKSDEKADYAVFLHEIGHLMGLEDQYSGNRADPRYNFFALPVAGVKPVMMVNSAQITCDDVDGVIFALDVQNGKKRGGEKGFLSLCSDRRYFHKDGRVETQVLQRYDADGRIAIKPLSNGKYLRYSYSNYSCMTPDEVSAIITSGGKIDESAPRCVDITKSSVLNRHKEIFEYKEGELQKYLRIVNISEGKDVSMRFRLGGECASPEVAGCFESSIPEGRSFSEVKEYLKRLRFLDEKAAAAAKIKIDNVSQIVSGVLAEQ